jgi:hypothetical protein
MQADVKLVEIMKWANFLPSDLAPGGVQTELAGVEKASRSMMHATTHAADRDITKSVHIGSISSNGVHSSLHPVRLQSVSFLLCMVRNAQAWITALVV